LPIGALNFTPELVTRCLDEAGETLVALRVGRLGPTGYRCSMPETLRDADDVLDSRRSAELAYERRRWDAPTPAQIAHMDEVLFRWMPLLGGELRWHWDRRRLIGLRALCWPQSDHEDPHVWSWRRLAELFRVHHETVKTRHERAIDVLCRRLPELPPPCAATVRRIRAYQQQCS
jgi:hypothetical protein